VGGIENVAAVVVVVAVIAVDVVEGVDCIADLYSAASAVVNMDVVVAVAVSAEMEAHRTVVDVVRMAMMDHPEEKAHPYPLHHPCCPSFVAAVAVDNYSMVALAAEAVVDIAVFVAAMDAVIEIASSVDHHCAIVAVAEHVAPSPSHHRHRQYNQRVLPDTAIQFHHTSFLNFLAL